MKPNGNEQITIKSLTTKQMKQATKTEYLFTHQRGEIGKKSFGVKWATADV